MTCSEQAVGREVLRRAPRRDETDAAGALDDIMSALSRIIPLASDIASLL
jgi:hypothetical protein